MRWFRWRILLILLSLLPLPVAADGGVLYVSPGEVVHSVGDTFEVQVLVDSGGVAVNAAEAEIEFNPAAVAVERVSTKDSLLTLWPTVPFYSNQEGVVRFSGLMEESFEGDNGLLLSVTFKALRNMSSNARLVSGAILAADGQGSNIITGMKSGVFIIRPQELEETANLDNKPVVEAAPTLMRPVFQPHDETVPDGGYIVLYGTAPPNSEVSIWVQKGNGQEVRTEVMSSADSLFSFTSEEQVSVGVYRVRAAVHAVDGGWGPSSDIQRFTVKSSGLLAAALLSISFLSDLLPLMAVFLLGGLGVGYLFHRHRIEKLKHGIR